MQILYLSLFWFFTHRHSDLLRIPSTSDPFDCCFFCVFGGLSPSESSDPELSESSSESSDPELSEFSSSEYSELSSDSSDSSDSISGFFPEK